MASIFGSKKCEQRENRTARYSEVMQAVEDIVKLDKSRLPAMVRLLMRPIAADFARHAFFHKTHEDQVSFEFDKFFFTTMHPVTQDGLSLSRLPGFAIGPNPVRQYRLDLAKDVLIPQPWHRERLIEAVLNKGHYDLHGKFRANYNHKAHFLLPVGLAWAEGGNHSLAAAIGDGSGSLVTREVFDFSVVYPYVIYDGDSFVRRHDRATLNRPKYEEAGILFEIGRRMLEIGVAYDAPLATEKEYQEQVFRK